MLYRSQFNLSYSPHDRNKVQYISDPLSGKYNSACSPFCIHIQGVPGTIDLSVADFKYIAFKLYDSKYCEWHISDLGRFNLAAILDTTLECII